MAAPNSKHAKQRDTRGSRAELRARNPRVQSALKKTREHQTELERRIEQEQRLSLESARTRLRQLLEEQPNVAQDKVGPARVTQKFAEQKVEYDRTLVEMRRLEEQAAKRAKWNLGAARSMYRQGYTLEHCVERTGWPASELADARMLDIIANEESFPCEECGKDLIDNKPNADGILICPRCGHREAI